MPLVTSEFATKDSDTVQDIGRPVTEPLYSEPDGVSDRTVTVSARSTTS
jgi:hypothetical protein